MAQRGRPKKIKAVVEPKLTPAYYEKELAQRDKEQQIQLEALYKELTTIKSLVDKALTQVGFVDQCENLAEAAFKAGRAYGPLDKANDELEEILDKIYDTNDFEDWRDSDYNY